MNVAQQSQKHESYTARLPFGSTQKSKAMTTHFLDKIYREMLFQKVALGYLLHFVQNGSSNNILKQVLLHNNLNNLEITRPGFHLGALKT